MFKQMADYWETNDYFRYSHSNLSLYEYLLNFAKTLSFVDHQLFGELLLFDMGYFISNPLKQIFLLFSFFIVNLLTIRRLCGIIHMELNIK
jgi:hypothetical protein